MALFGSKRGQKGVIFGPFLAFFGTFLGTFISKVYGVFAKKTCFFHLFFITFFSGFFQFLTEKSKNPSHSPKN